MGDLPDYTREMVLKGAAGFTGLEELAARLGSIVPWNMLGNIVLMEDFESEETEWNDNSAGGSSTTSRSSRHKYSGDWALKLYCANIAYARALSWRYLAFPGLSKYAVFTRFAWNETASVLRLYLTLRSGTSEFYPRVAYDLLNTTLKVMSTGQLYHNVDTDLELGLSSYVWYPILVTFDLNTGYYDKLYITDLEYDISDVPLYSTSLGLTPFAAIGVSAESIPANEFTAYVDDIIIAKNVP